MPHQNEEKHPIAPKHSLRTFSQSPPSPKSLAVIGLFPVHIVLFFVQYHNKWDYIV